MGDTGDKDKAKADEVSSKSVEGMLHAMQKTLQSMGSRFEDWDPRKTFVFSILISMKILGIFQSCS